MPSKPKANRVGRASIIAWQGGLLQNHRGPPAKRDRFAERWAMRLLPGVLYEQATAPPTAGSRDQVMSPYSQRFDLAAPLESRASSSSYYSKFLPGRDTFRTRARTN
jgi:hypothetical protein